MRRAMLALVCAWIGLATAAEARILRIDITRDEPAFGGRAFGDAGAYRHITGIAHGAVDPADPRNAGIQDLWLAPRDAQGRVAYDSPVDILVPADRARGNSVLFLEVVNRGNKLAPLFFNLGTPQDAATRNALTDPGDGLLFREGYTMVWFGWQADVPPGGGRLGLAPVVAHRPDGTPITGIVRAELSTAAPAPDLALTARAQVAVPPAPYLPASTDTTTPDASGFLPTLTVRAREQDPRVPIPNTQWRFGACGAEGKADPARLCLEGAFQPGHLYELIYRARDPLVLGLGFAAARDLAAFLRDDTTDANPVRREGQSPGDQSVVIEGTSQSGRFIRSLIQLGYTETEDGKRAFDGAFIHVASARIALDQRFGQPDRNGGEQSDHLYPAYEFPFSYLRQNDPLTGRTQGLLDRCQATNTCPRIFHVNSALEFWELRASLGLTDPLGRADLPEIPDVRTYVLASTQHVPVPWTGGPQPASTCQQASNPNPQTYTMRALLLGLTRWVREGVPPPHSVVPRIADGTLVPPDLLRFPPIPAVDYDGVAHPALPPGIRPLDPLHVLFFGPRFDPATLSGEVTVEPPVPLAGSYGVLVPQVDADGNDIAGIRSLFLRVPVGTYTGWNLGRAGHFENGACHLQGGFIPFAPTREARERAGDPRLSLAERYPEPRSYVFAVTAAAKALNADQFLLIDDALALIAQAQREGVRAGP
jgi:hypothetical protein